MADEREFGSQELVSAKYLAQVEETIEPEIEQPARRTQPNRTGLEQTIRWLSPLVLVMMVAAGGGLYWHNRASLASSATNFKKHSTCGVDWLLWAAGSKKTFNEGLSDSIKRAQRESAFQFDETKPAFKTEFDHVDFQNLSEAWNGKR
jgi:hypothetical protein